jgi:hypothetical protein
MADRSRCPNCREPVSPYAAGCAVCGADLDTARWDTGPGVGNRIGSWFSSLGAGHTYSGPWVLIGLIAFFAFGGSIVAWLTGIF